LVFGAGVGAGVDGGAASVDFVSAIVLACRVFGDRIARAGWVELFRFLSES